MRWLTNTYDPSKPDADFNIVVSSWQTREQAIEDHMKYLSDKIIGRPKETAHYTVEQLKEMGMVGVYSRVD